MKECEGCEQVLEHISGAVALTRDVTRQAQLLATSVCSFRNFPALHSSHTLSPGVMPSRNLTLYALSLALARIQ